MTVTNAQNITVQTIGVGHSYSGRVALTGIDLSLNSGATALVGVNGAGKSTLLRTLAGAQQPAMGLVRVGGLDPYHRRDRRAALSRVALMPQTATFPGNMTVHEVVSFVGWMRGLGSRTAGRRAADVIERVGLAARSADRMKSLSGGMARRVALAQALVSTPDVLLLDEPSTGLDPEQRRAMVLLIKDLDATVLFSSHIIEDVLDVAERVVVLESGRVIFDDALTALAAAGAAAGRGGPGASDLEAGFLRVVSRSRGRES